MRACMCACERVHVYTNTGAEPELVSVAISCSSEPTALPTHSATDIGTMCYPPAESGSSAAGYYSPGPLEETSPPLHCECSSACSSAITPEQDVASMITSPLLNCLGNIEPSCGASYVPTRYIQADSSDSSVHQFCPALWSAAQPLTAVSCAEPLFTVSMEIAEICYISLAKQNQESQMIPNLKAEPDCCWGY